MKYAPHLDSLRAIAALLVVAWHAKVPIFLGGFVGVDLFFVLSGYLITNVFTKNPELKSFYINRALRLTPPLALMLIAYLAIFPFIFPAHNHVTDALISIAYLSDYATAFWDTPKYLVHTWSLAVEEHFYLLWPLIVIRFKPTVSALLVAYILASFFRSSWPDFFEAYSKFDTRLSGLVLGCLIASVKIDQKFPAWPGVLVLILAASTLKWGTQFTQSWGFFIVEIAAAIAILGTAPKWLESAPLAYFGKLSYGIYLWHYPIVKICREYHLSWEMTFTLSLLPSIALSALSYHFVEKYFRDLRHKKLPPAKLLAE